MKTETVLTKENIEMAYFSFGRGEKAFVILPGVDVKSVLLAAKSVANAYKRFAEDYTVYVFDRRRHLPDGYTIRQMASDTAAVMRELGIRDADVFGASQGGMIAQYLAADDPELVHAMVLGSTAAVAGETITATCDEWIRLAQAHDITALTADFIDRLYSEKTVSRFRNFLIHMNDSVTDEDLDRFIILVKAMTGFDTRGDLHRIQCPVLVVGVENDLAVGADASHELAELLGCELFMYGDEYGHCVFDEAPDYKQRILEFFQAHR